MKPQLRLLAAAAALAPTAAWAHPGHEGAGGLYAGMAHPLTGIDHLVAMLLVGVWAGLLSRTSPLPFRGGAGGGACPEGTALNDRPHPNPSPEGEGLWQALSLPGLFLGAMLTGFFVGPLIGGTFAEPLILLSLVTLGAAAAFRFRAPVPLAMTAVAVFGFAHGMAHGFETPSGAFPVLFAAGFALSTAGLHGAGLWLARVLPASAMRILGAAGAGLGLALGLAG